MLGLIFVKFISDTFQSKRTELAARFADPAHDYFLEDRTPELLAAELEDRDYYREVNVFWVPEAARWEALRAAAKADRHRQAHRRGALAHRGREPQAEGHPRQLTGQKKNRSFSYAAYVELLAR